MALALALPAPVPCRECWRPPVGGDWQWQLRGELDASVEAPVYDVDGLTTDASAVAALHARGRRVICYIDVGSWEDFRPDAGSFPADVLGKPLEGFEDERWLDIRRLDVLAPILRARMQVCRERGFDAIEPDNVDGYANDTGFRLTAADQIAFNVWVANTAHGLGLSVALKNDGEQVRRLLPYFDFAIVEQCFQYNECEQYLPFIRARKAVLAVEYELPPARFCAKARKLRFSALRKELDLGPHRVACPR